MKIIKNVVKGFVSKKIITVSSLVSVALLLGVVIAILFFSSSHRESTESIPQNKMNDTKNNAKNAMFQNQMNNPAVNKNVSSTSVSIAKSAAVLAAQCAVCKSIIKSGAPSSCMKELKCK